MTFLKGGVDDFSYFSVEKEFPKMTFLKGGVDDFSYFQSFYFLSTIIPMLLLSIKFSHWKLLCNINASKLVWNIPYKDDVWFVFPSSYLLEGSCFINIVYVYLCMVVPTHIVLCFCFVFHPLEYPMLPVSLDCPFLIVPSEFSNVYYLLMLQCKKISEDLELLEH